MDIKKHQKITHCEYACCEHDHPMLCERYYICGWGGSPEEDARWICWSCFEGVGGFEAVYTIESRLYLCPTCKTHLPSELFVEGADTLETANEDLDATVAQVPCEDCGGFVLEPYFQPDYRYY